MNSLPKLSGGQAEPFCPAASPRSYPSQGYAAWALALLFLSTFFSLLDRFLVGLMTTPIKQEFSLTDTQVSLLQGFAFVICYSFCGLAFGRMVDRSNRRNIVIAGIVLWCMMTVLCGFARSYTELFIARLGVGIGEACLAPAAYSLITDYFRPRFHGRALAIFTLGSVFGAGGSYIIGGMVFTALKSSPEFVLPWVGVLAPWRATFVLVGLPGLLIAALLLTIREPVRQERVANAMQKGPSQQSPLTLRQYLTQDGKALYYVAFINALTGLVTTGLSNWMPTFLVRTYNVPISWVGHSVGATLVAGSLVGALLGGWLADTQFIVQRTGQKLYVSLIGIALTVPFLIAFPLASSPLVSLMLFGFEVAMINLSICTAPAVLQDIVPNHLKGQVTALYWMVVALVGLSVGPTAIALVTDYVFQDDRMLRYSLIAVGVPGLIAALILVLISLKTYQSTCTKWQLSAH